MVSRAVLCLSSEMQILQQALMVFSSSILKPRLQQTASSLTNHIMYVSAAWHKERAVFLKLGGAHQSCKGFRVLL